MAAITFSYRSKKPESFLEVRLSFRKKGEQNPTSLYCRCKISVTRDFWADYSKDKKFKDIQKIKLKDEVDRECGNLRNYILTEFEKYNTHTKEWFKEIVNKYYNPLEIPINIPDRLLDYFEYYLDTNKHIKDGTKRKINVIKNRIKKNLFPSNILLTDIDDNFRNQVYKSLNNYAPNTIEYTLKEIKMICLHAQKKGYHISKDVEQWALKYKQPIIVYLNEEEIEKIKKLNKLSEDLETAKDWLIISCYTGQRISDFMRFKKDMIRSHINASGKIIKLIEFNQIKTGAAIALPLHNEVVNILNKRNGEFPPRMLDQLYNELIKTVCKKAGIIQRIKGSKKLETFNGSKTYRKIDDEFPKYQLVTSHIGRRSFATNNFGKIPTPLIMAATGHKKEEMFLRYIGKTQTDQAISLAEYF